MCPSGHNFFCFLIAGAGATDAPSFGGALPFVVYASPSDAWWDYGSAFMLVASAVNPPAHVGALTFDVSDTPSWATWNFGSASF